MLLWIICIMISFLLLFKDTSTPSILEIGICVLFAHFIALIALVLFGQHLIRFIKFYRGNHG